MARSVDECELYLKLHPCACGEPGFRPETRTERTADGLLTSYQGRCPSCGRDREFRFRTAHPLVNSGFGSDAPSQIIDPGEFLWESAVTANEIETPPEDVELEMLPGTIRTLARSVACAEQVLCFLPPNTRSVPARAFTSPLGKAMFRSNPEWFERDNLVVLLANCRNWLTAYERRLEAEAAQQKQPPLARSYDEIALYHELHPCGCGQAGLQREESSIVAVDGGLATRNRSRCTGCGKLREFQFRLADDILENGLNVGRYGGAAPSELIDAGEWMYVSKVTSSRWPAYIGRLSPDQQQQARKDLAISIAAVEEILKFIPSNADEVPPEAFWTPRGRQVRAEELSFRFRRDMIQVVLDEYRRIQQDRRSRED